MKSVSALPPKRAPRRLSRLLTRKVRFSDTVVEDMPYLWAAYRKGSLAVLEGKFLTDMGRNEFIEAFSEYIEVRDVTPISFYADVNGREQMVGMGMFWVRGRVAQTENLIWFPWGSSRLTLESYVNFINDMRKRIHADTGKPYVVLEFAMEKDKGFFEHVCSYGVMRRVGTSEEIYSGEKCCIYESRGVTDA